MRKTKIAKIAKGDTEVNTHQKTNHEMVDLKLHNHWLQEQLEKEREMAEHSLRDANLTIMFMQAEIKQDRNHSYALSERQERLINKLLDKNHELQQEVYEAKREFLDHPVNSPDEPISVRNWHKRMMDKPNPAEGLKELLFKGRVANCE